MRESNFAFPAQNRACVCISSQLYDRRALDTTSPLPLLNSLTHLTYLTSTSPRIREILTCDGGLERLVRLLRDFCLSPPPPENPSAIFGLSPPGLPRPAQVPTLNPKSFDRHSAYRFSLAFQCVVNIGVRGSEPIRSRVVQAGTLEVVGCILEAWLASKGFAVGPSANASGLPRESREQRQQRRQQQLEQRQREQAQELARLLDLERSIAANAEEDQNIATSDAETSVSTDTSANATPSRSGTPTSTVIVPGRDRSGTVVARRVWDAQSNAHEQTSAGPSMARSRTVRARMAVESTTPSASTSRPDTETEDDGEPDADGDVEMETASHDMDENVPPRTLSHARRTVGIVSDSPSPASTAAVGAGVAGASDALDVDMDAHIIINTNAGDDGVAEGIVALEQNVNDDLAMGAPPGAPGAIDATPRTRTNTLTLNTRNINMQREHHGHHPHVHGREELTPRAVLATLPMHHTHSHSHSNTHAPAPIAMSVNTTNAGPSRTPAIAQAALRAAQANANAAHAAGLVPTALAPPPRPSHRHHHHHHPDEQGPYRDEDVVLSLQLLAYLSKYPHVRQAFYRPRLSFHPATATAQGQNAQNITSTPETSGWRKTGAAASGGATATGSAADVKKDIGFFKTLTGRGKEKEKEKALSATQPAPTPNPPRMTNVFSLVERFTFKPSPTESSLAQPPPFLPVDIQYWAGVIMRNACRKDESRGGIRQCANMLCGKWESYPREFAKCRRCRKAKYCGKECQSRAWSEGHRFWCSAREEGDGVDASAATATTGGANAAVTASIAQQGQTAENGVESETASSGTGGSRATLDRIERRQARDRERQRMSGGAAAALAALQPAPSAGSAMAVARNASTSSTSTETVRRGLVTRPSASSASGDPFMGSGGPPETTGHLDFASAAHAQETLRQQTAAAGTSITSFASGNGMVRELPLDFNLNAYNADEQATIRNFLQAVGMAEMEADPLLAPVPRGAIGPAADRDDVNIDIDFHQRGRERERERVLPERIQAMNVRDRTYDSSDSTSRSPGEGSTTHMEVSEDENVMVLE